MTEWDRRYRAGEHLRDEPHPLVTRFAGALAPGLALDVACGPGRHALWLAERGWNVTAVDSSPAAIEILKQRATQKRLVVNAVLADLEKHEFVIEPARYDLILVCNYLQRDLFPSIRAGMRIGGTVIAIIAMVDPDPDIRPMNPAYLLSPGELRAGFEGWELIHNFEGKPPGDTPRRATAEIVARKGVD
jgi:tellurite methyltransferase